MKAREEEWTGEKPEKGEERNGARRIQDGGGCLILVIFEKPWRL